MQEHSMLLPLRHARFRQLWLANLLSNTGTSTAAFALAWQVASTSGSPLLTALVQSAAWAPLLLLALPAGALADSRHRPTLLLRSNGVMALTACAMALLAFVLPRALPALLLLSLLMGCAAAFMIPAWQASMSVLVPARQVEAAATLNNLSFNLAALAGPVLGSVLFGLVGAAPLYLFNALSFGALLWAYRQWRSADGPRAGAPAAPWPSLRGTLAASWRSAPFRRLLLCAAAVFFIASAFAALLPLLGAGAGRQPTRAGAYASLLAALGAGAALAILVLPPLRSRLARRQILVAALALYGVMLAALGLELVASRIGQALLVLCGGLAWSAIVSTLNGAAQSAFPDAWRARTLSVYIVAVAAGQVGGSAAWGQLATHYGVAPALGGAGIAMLCCALALAFSNDFLERT